MLATLDQARAREAQGEQTLQATVVTNALLLTPALADALAERGVRLLLSWMEAPRMAAFRKTKPAFATDTTLHAQVSAALAPGGPRPRTPGRDDRAA